MSEIELRSVTKRFGTVTAIDRLSLAVKDKEFLVLLGPTGAGKTTTLRTIAGLETPDAGDIRIDGQSVLLMSPAARDLAFIFQQYSLYPHYTVFDNLAFPLRSKLRRQSEDAIKQKVDATAEILHISHLLERHPDTLSGGEMQRVAIGRAIIRQPRAFLMDEPLSNLDAKLREELRAELKRLQFEVGATTLYVTHDQMEAMSMADRVGVLNEGHLIQLDHAEMIYNQPANTFVAALVGSPRINLLDVKFERGTLSIGHENNAIRPPEAILSKFHDIPRDAIFGIRPENIVIGSEGDLKFEVYLVENFGVEDVVYLKSGPVKLVITASSDLNVQLGESVACTFDPERIHLFTRNGETLRKRAE
ncbi:ABC transporter ATP-binding protein [candidate division KSB1 bacterium]|nr:ABC transporter ATP-binding protein [candidate division KSB1 bacterium]